jgi:uncharacterized membrane protein YkvA (DUF1232 family)
LSKNDTSFGFFSDIRINISYMTLHNFSKHYSDTNFLTKIGQFAKKAGVKIMYYALLLFYAYRRADTPAWAKRIILGALGYFLAPIDAIPDFTPFIGFTDDASVLVAAVAAVAVYINADVKQKAKAKLHDWFGEFDETTTDFEIME